MVSHNLPLAPEWIMVCILGSLIFILIVLYFIRRYLLQTQSIVGRFPSSHPDHEDFHKCHTPKSIPLGSAAGNLVPHCSVQVYSQAESGRRPTIEITPADLHLPEPEPAPMPTLGTRSAEGKQGGDKPPAKSATTLLTATVTTTHGGEKKTTSKPPHGRRVVVRNVTKVNPATKRASTKR